MITAIHGFTGAPSFWQGLGTGLQALTVLGHGPTAPARGDESFEGEVDRLAALLPERCDSLLGYSLGARLSLAIALRYPGRVGSLTLIGVHPGLCSRGEQEARRVADQKWIELLESKGIEAFVEAWESLPMWQSQKSLPEAIRTQQKQERLRHDPLQLAHALRALGTGVMPPMWEELPTLEIPVHLIVGCRDEKFLAIAESMLPRLLHGKLSVVEDAGHNPVLECPARTFQLLSGTPAAKVAQHA